MGEKKQPTRGGQTVRHAALRDGRDVVYGGESEGGVRDDVALTTTIDQWSETYTGGGEGRERGETWGVDQTSTKQQQRKTKKR